MTDTVASLDETAGRLDASWSALARVLGVGPDPRVVALALPSAPTIYSRALNPAGTFEAKAVADELISTAFTSRVNRFLAENPLLHPSIQTAYVRGAFDRTVARMDVLSERGYLDKSKLAAAAEGFVQGLKDAIPKPPAWLPTWFIVTVVIAAVALVAGAVYSPRR